MKAFAAALFALCAGIAGIAPAHATPVTFTATGNADVVGYVQFDDATFNGSSFQHVSNTQVTDLSLVVFGVSFGLADVRTDHGTYIDSSGLAPLIVNGDGTLAQVVGPHVIAFFPDGQSGTTLDGDAALEFGASLFNGDFYAVRWVADTAATAPEPGTLALILSGLAGFGFARRRR